MMVTPGPLAPVMPVKTLGQKYLHGENINEHVKSLFSLEKIREMLKADKFSEEAEIRLGSDMPLSLILNMVTGDGNLSFLLAPRLESDE